MKRLSIPGMTGRRAFARIAAAALVAVSAHAGAASSVIEGQDGWLFPGWEHTDSVNRAQLDANIKTIEQTRRDLAAQHIDLILMVVPAKAVFYPQRLPANVQIAPQVKTRYDDILGELKTADVATFDDRPVLHAVEHDQQTAFYRADYHWTAWSAEASADVMAKLIQDRFKLPPNGTGATLGDWTNDRRFGDLAMNFLAPEDRKRIGRDTYTVRKQPENAGGDLLGGAPAQVQVIGNSFVQPYLGFTQKLSNALGQPVGLTWNPGNVGPWKTFLDYVETPDFAQHKPKVIVWQFNEAQIENNIDSADSWDAKSLMSSAEWLNRMSAAVAK
jgi:alginate O-acetyltransferase complex protein AlgJ